MAIPDCRGAPAQEYVHHALGAPGDDARTGQSSDLTDRAAQVFRTRHRYVWPSEMDLMAQGSGLVLENRAADWVGTVFDGACEPHVPVYRLQVGS